MSTTLTLNNGVEMPALGFGVFQTPPEETVAAVETALRTGYRHVDTAAAYGNEREVGEGIRRSGVDRSEVFVTEQPTYSILTRGIENEVLPVCRRYGMGVLSYSPLTGGWLSGRYGKDDQTGPMSVARQRLANRFGLSLPENQRKLDAADALAQLADEAGISLIEMAIAFVLRHPGSPSTPRTTAG